MKQHIPFHVHPSSMDSGSTVEAIISRCKELQKDLPVQYATTTDHGFMGDCFKFYDICKKKKVKPILGVEGYFKDTECDISNGTESEKVKYFHVILHFMDQAAYQKGCELLSDADKRAITAGGERKPIFTWKDLETFSKYNVTLGTACLLGMTARHLLVKNPEAAAKHYLKLREMFKENFYVELLPHVCDKKWENGIRLHFDDNTSLFVRNETKLDTDYKLDVTALEVYNYSEKVNEVYTRYYRRQGIAINKKLVSVEKIKDFVLQEEGDVQLLANKFNLAMARKYGDKIVISDDAHYALPEDKIVQDMRLGEDFRFYGSYHLLQSVETYKYFQEVMGIDEATIDSWVENSYEWAKRFDNFELKYEYSLVKTERPPISIFADWMKEVGRLEKHKNDSRYIQQLKYELDVFSNNGVVDVLPYFIPIREVVEHYSKNGQVTGSLRGSCGGSVLLYFIGVTHVDPIKYDLPFSRFFSKERVVSGDLPDVDLDLNKKSLLMGEDKKSGFLYEKYGDCVAQISTRMLMRLKSSIKDVNRYKNKGDVEPEIDKIAEGLPIPPQGISDKDFVYGYADNEGTEHEGIIDTSDVLKKYIEQRPDEWAVVERCLGLARNNSAHASGVCIAGRPLKEIMPTFSIGSSPMVCQYEAKSVENAKVIKYDFLCISVLNDITSCLNFVNKKNGDVFDRAGYFNFEGNKTFIWDLPVSKTAFDELNTGFTETTFQTNTKAMRPFVEKIQPQSVDDLSIILALCRPGPMDYKMDNGRTMAEEYIFRRKGLSQPDIPELAEILPETYGIMVYQESLGKICKQFAGMDPLRSEHLRKMMSKKKKKEMDAIKPDFVQGAINNGYKLELAEKIWGMMETFARYGFNRCLTGDTVVYRGNNGGGNSASSYTIKELYLYMHSTNQKPIAKKIRSTGFGNILALDTDGRVRPKKIKNISFEGYKKVFLVKTDTGKTIKATDNHRFLTDSGWLEVNQLDTKKHKIAVQGEYQAETEIKYPHRHFAGYENIKKILKEQKTCSICGLYFNEENKPEHHHHDGNPRNNTLLNISKLCNSCHKKADYSTGLRKKRFSKGYPVLYENIESITPLDTEEVFDIEMEDSPHAFVANGLISHNSHSIGYAHITYATAFLKHHYPLEWWAAILTNADNKEINESFFKYVKDLLISPDINASDEAVTIDYQTGKLRSKLSMVSGLGEKAAEKIKSGRPYLSVEDMVQKRTVPESLARKLIYIGVMDSLFAPNTSTLCKLQKYEDCLVRLKKKEKIHDSLTTLEAKMVGQPEKELAKSLKKKDKLLQDLALADGLTGQIPEEYIGIAPIREFLIKKSLLPSLPMDLHNCVKKYAKCVINANDRAFSEDSKGRTSPLLPGSAFQLVQNRVDEKDVAYSAAVYILDAKEFVYGGTKRALKMQCDIDGFSTELVLWPDYESGELNYPDKLKKSVCIMSFWKKQGKEHGRITEIKLVDTLSEK